MLAMPQNGLLERNQLASRRLDSFKKYDIDYVKWIAEPSACKICVEIATFSSSDSLEAGIYRTVDVPAIPVHPNCRCSIAGYIPRANEEYETTRKEPFNINAEPAMFASEYKHAIKQIEQFGDTVLRGGKEVNHHLDISGAAAASIEDIILFRNHPSRKEE